MKFYLFLMLNIFLGSNLIAQDTLPNFKAINLYNGKTIISWKSNYLSNVKQISIQRSTDSLKNFRTIATMPNPNVPLNGYSDNKATLGIKYFYKFYIVLEGNIFINTKSKAAKVDTSWKKDKNFKFGNDVVDVKKGGKKPAFVPQYIFNAKSGDLILKLRDASEKAVYSVVFYSNKEKFLELKNLTENYYIIDKVNFVKKDCYTYEVYLNDVLIENYYICL